MALYNVTNGNLMGLVHAVSNRDAVAYIEQHLGEDSGPYWATRADDRAEDWFSEMGGADTIPVTSRASRRKPNN